MAVKMFINKVRKKENNLKERNEIKWKTNRNFIEAKALRFSATE